MSDPNLNPKNKIVAIYNQSRQLDGLLPIDIEDYVMSLPAPYTGSRSNKNTRIYLIPKLLSSQFSKIPIYYNRIDLGLIDTQQTKVVMNNSYTNTLDYLNEINESLGVEMEQNDIQNNPVDSNGFILAASSDNYAFIGQCYFTYY